MGDEAEDLTDDLDFSSVEIRETTGRSSSVEMIYPDKLWELHGIRILSWEIAPPVVNSFVE